MKRHTSLLSFALTAISIAASGQCARPDLTPKWNADKSRFTCVDPTGSRGSASDGVVLPTGDKRFCSSARENLLKVCPVADEGKFCRGEAKSVFSACYKKSRESGDRQADGPGRTDQTSKTDASACMTIFAQQQQACGSRKIPPASPGQQSVPDTCLQDAIAAQDKCLASSR